MKTVEEIREMLKLPGRYMEWYGDSGPKDGFIWLIEEIKEDGHLEVIAALTLPEGYRDYLYPIWQDETYLRDEPYMTAGCFAANLEEILRRIEKNPYLQGRL